MDESCSGASRLEAQLAASVAECRRLADELARARERIAELERKLGAPPEPSHRAVTRAREPAAPATGGGSAWDRAVSAIRRERTGRAEPEPMRATRPAARPAPAAAPAPAPKPTPLAPAPPVPEAPSAPPERVERAPAPAPRARTGDEPCFLDAVAREKALTEGQREALRSTYRRFVPDAAPRSDSSPAVSLSILESLEGDPALSRGQREALRAMLGTLGRK